MSIKLCISVLKDYFILAESADPDEMLHYPSSQVPRIKKG